MSQRRADEARALLVISRYTASIYETLKPVDKAACKKLMKTIIDRTPELIGGIEQRAILIVDYRPEWSEIFLKHAAAIGEALGDGALRIEHVGSTAIPGLAAKPIVDILLIVQNSANESTYLPHLQTCGYLLRVREPAWHEHRMLRTLERDVHIHVFSSGSPEIDRMLTFRDRLRVSSEDRARYEAVKRNLAAQEWSDMNAYAAAKTEIVEAILARTGG